MLKNITKILLLFALVISFLSGCVSKPKTSKFFTARRIKKNQYSQAVEYPSGFIAINQRYFNDSDKAFFILYYNNCPKGNFHTRYYNSTGKLCYSDKPIEVPHSVYYCRMIFIHEHATKYGNGKFRADLYRDNKKIDSLCFYLNTKTQEQKVSK